MSTAPTSASRSRRSTPTPATSWRPSSTSPEADKPGAEEPLRVLFEDPRIIAVDKPCGQSVIPDRAGGLDESVLVAQVGRYLGGKAWVVHRLDRGTSGVVLFAKDAATHRALCGLFEARRVHKTYLALVHGQVESGGAIDQPLRVFGSGRVGVDPRGKPSTTIFRVKQALREAALLEIEPRTGRRHQIRAHLRSIGHPVLGDMRYGKQYAKGVGRLMLHALEVSFELEGSGLIKVRAEPPVDFLEVVARFSI